MIALALVLQVVTAPAGSVDTSSLATKAEVQAIQAAQPQPAASTPPSEMLGGQTGSQTRYAREDHTHPRITRAAVVTTDSSGGWTVTWSSPVTTPPVVLPVPVNSSTQPIVCNVATRTTTAATGRCWLARTLPATLTLLTNLVSFDLFGAAATGIQVQVLAIPVTQ